MGHNWIIDVIADLQKFAHSNALPLLAAELTKAKTVAVVEVAAIKGDAALAARGEETDAQRIFPQPGNR